MAIYPTQAALAAATVPSGDLAVKLLGYYAAGDCPEMNLLRVSTAPTHAAYFTDFTGAFFENVEEIIDPRMLGYSPSRTLDQNSLSVAQAVNVARSVDFGDIEFEFYANADTTDPNHQIIISTPGQLITCSRGGKITLGSGAPISPSSFPPGTANFVVTADHVRFERIYARNPHGYFNRDKKVSPPQYRSGCINVQANYCTVSNSHFDGFCCALSVSSSRIADPLFNNTTSFVGFSAHDNLITNCIGFRDEEGAPVGSMSDPAGIYCFGVHNMLCNNTVTGKDGEFLLHGLKIENLAPQQDWFDPLHPFEAKVGLIEGNFVFGPFTHGLYVDAVEDIAILNNQVWGVATNAIKVAGNQILVQGNTVEATDQSLGWAFNAETIDIESGTNIDVFDNTIICTKDVSDTADPTDGIVVNGTAGSVRVSRNRIVQGAPFHQNYILASASGFFAQGSVGSVSNGTVFAGNLGYSLPAQWAQSTSYAIGDEVQNGTRGYVCTIAGTSAATGGGPTGTGSGIVDGTVTWNYGSAIVSTDILVSQSSGYFNVGDTLTQGAVTGVVGSSSFTPGKMRYGILNSAGSSSTTVEISANSISNATCVGGIRLAGSLTNVRIAFNSIAGCSGDGIATVNNSGTNAHTKVDILNNVVYNSGSNGYNIVCASASRCVVTGNEAYGSTGIGMLIVGGVYDYFVGNRASGPTSPQITLTGASATVARDNTGYVTYNNGGSSIGSASTSVNVTHGLNVTPTVNQVRLTLTGSLHTAKAIWVSAVSSTTFTVTCDAAPGAALNFNWEVNAQQ